MPARQLLAAPVHADELTARGLFEPIPTETPPLPRLEAKPERVEPGKMLYFEPRLSRLERHEPLVFALLLAVVILPVWLFKFFPGWDSPLHLNMVDSIANYGRSGYEILTQYLTPNQALEPNLAIYYLLRLFAWFSDLHVAEKIFLTLYAILLGYAGRFAVSVINPQASVISLLFIPTIFTMFIHRGFYNFCLSSALYLLILAFWFKRRLVMTPWDLAALATFSLLQVLVHLVGFAVLALTIGAIGVYDCAYALTRPGDAGLRRAVAVAWVSRALKLGLALLPAMVVAASFMIRHGIEEASAYEQDRLDLLLRLLTMDHLYSFSRIEIGLYAPFVLLTATLGAIALARRWREPDRGVKAQDGFGFAALALTVLYFSPALTTKGVPVSERLLPFLFALGFFWLATMTPGSLARRSIPVVVALVCVTTAGYRIWQYHRLNGFLAEYVSAADYIDPHSTLLPIHFWRETDGRSGRRLTWRIEPLYHAAGHIGIERNVINLRNHFLSPEVLGYFPMRYREHLDPFVHLGKAIDGKPPAAEILSYEERTGGSVDYVLIMATEPIEAAGDPAAAAIAAQLDRAYELIYTSPGYGFVRLYRRTAHPEAPSE